MTVTVVYFQPDSENGGNGKSGDVGYDVTATGTVFSIDPVYRVLKIDTGRQNEKGPVVDVIRFDDLLDMSGLDIVDIDAFLGIEDLSKHYRC